MFWMKAGNVTGGGSESAMLWDRRIGGVGGIVGLMNTTFNATNAGKLFFQPNGGGSSLFSTVRVDDSQWHHVAFVYNQAAGGTDTFYVDGVARGAVMHGTAWAWPAAQQIELGRSHDGYWHKYNGLLDEVRFYNTGLSAAQVASISNGADENVSASDVGLSLSGTLPGNAGAFIRIPFTVSNPANYQTLRLTVRANGQFSIAGLRPGPHILRVEPIDDADPESFFDVTDPPDINFRAAYVERLVVVPKGGDSGNVEVKVVVK